MSKVIFSTLFWVWTVNLIAQDNNTQDTDTSKQRLDFAKSYFEFGGSIMPSFSGSQLINSQVNTFTHPASINQYLTWGAFHFWGHAEFYVTFPLKHNSFSKNEETDFALLHNVATGGRFYPWAVREKKIRPYVGLSWGRLGFQQEIKPEENQPLLVKDFMLNYEAGFTYNYGNLGLRLGINYFNDNKWQYPISRTQKSAISTPAYSIQFGAFYAFDLTKSETDELIDEWNSYPKWSKLSYDARKFGDFFLAAGPSSSFSLVKSAYNQSQFPFLKETLASKTYFDLSIGYQFNKANLFTALSFRNPTYETSAFGVEQRIKKNSLALEVNKYLTDYTGFAPYVGINVAYDHIAYREEVDGMERELRFSNQIEPGISFGWDIVPGKTSDAAWLILRTNLRWYPFSTFEVDGKSFNFSQLEYNLIQAVFYPDRLRKRKK